MPAFPFEDQLPWLVDGVEESDEDEDDENSQWGQYPTITSLSRHIATGHHRTSRTRSRYVGPG